LGLSCSNQAEWFDSFAVSADRGIVYLLKPATYANQSGLAVREALGVWNIDPAEFFVICDDFNLSLGALRIRKSGSSGGHKGLASIIEELGQIRFPRMRVGIGPLPVECKENWEKIPEYVLSRFQPNEIDIIENAVSHAVEALLLILKGNLDLAISRYNRINPTPKH
jgi:PTH1 family peptidyl-tRNA hydrolase